LQQTVEPNKTLLIDGPAAVRLLEGKVEVFGYPIRLGKRVIARKGKRLPFFATEKALLNVELGVNAAMEEMDGSTIPESWNQPLQAAQNLQKRPVVILVLGQPDCGKSSLCTYLVNKLVDGGKCKVAVLDADLGQSDIGPSATVGYAMTTKRMTQLYKLKLENAFFVGTISAVTAIARTVEAVNAMKMEILTRQPDYVVVNTDGWIVDEIAVRYKQNVVKALDPDIIVGVQIQNEMSNLIAALEKPVMVVGPSEALSQRTPERRKLLREMTYIRYLRRSKLQCLVTTQMTVEPRSSIPKTQDPEKGILVGLYARKNKFLGIGVLRKVNPVRKVLKVQTPVAEKPARLVIGKIYLDLKNQETTAS
jgi:polynucleotide 5'-hydroxyl-kinase GRC3/NOL9